MQLLLQTVLAMDYVATTVPLEEQSLIIKTNLSDVAAVDQLFWPLSVSEASAIHANELTFSRDWWLRSAGLDASGAVFVNLNGIVFPYGGSVSSVGGIRPAFKVNLESVIFSPSDLGRKPTTVDADLTTAVPNTYAVKLTVKETNPANLNLTIADISAIGAMPGETVSIDYTGTVESTTIAPNKYVSCVVEDSNGAIKYYAKLETAANGTAYITIPADMPPGNNKIRLFNEQCHADNYTDFASNPIDISLTVESSPTIDDSATGADSINLIEGYGAYTKTYTIAGFPAPKVAVTSDGGTGTTATTTGELTIPTGLTKGNYTVVLTASNGHLPNATMTVTVNVAEAPTVPTVPTVTPISLSVQEGTTGSFAVFTGTGTDKATSVSIVSDDTVVATVDKPVLTANDTGTAGNSGHESNPINMRFVSLQVTFTDYKIYEKEVYHEKSQ